MIPAILLLQQTTRRFTAETSVMIEASETNDVLTDRSMTVGHDRLTEATVQTEADLIASAVLARRVIDKLKLEQDPEFNIKLRRPKPIDVFFSYLSPLHWIPASWLSDGEPAQAAPDIRASLEQSRVIRAFR